ncbi:hypothetical protein CDV31_004927 [Fusarium ambrosium]|uniref:Uncharacterized protein n=1 Tax=Fusarium ambrosium TaxID=131363 RepID=A0A428UME5_9HYPO|nr:hypothetical protein CDV31_004927 [Fusarium ambrosium]
MEGGVNGLLQKFFVAACMASGMTEDQVWSDGVVTGKQDANYECYDQASKYYFIPFITFDRLLRELIPNSFIVLGDGRHGEYDDATSNWASLTNKFKFKQDQIILSQHVTDLLAVAIRGPTLKLRMSFFAE